MCIRDRSRTAQKEVQEPPDRGALKNKTNMSNNYINNTKINKTKSNNNQSNHILSDQGEKCAQTEKASSNNKPMDEIRFEYDKKTQVRGYEKVIKMKIDYDYLIDRHPHEKERIDGMIEIMVETLVSDSDYINIGGTEYPKEVVKMCIRDSCRTATFGGIETAVQYDRGLGRTAGFIGTEIIAWKKGFG